MFTYQLFLQLEEQDEGQSDVLFKLYSSDFMGTAMWQFDVFWVSTSSDLFKMCFSFFNMTQIQ